MKSIFSFILILIFLSGCKKEYDCVCTNPGGSQAVFSVKESKSKAKKACSDYYDQHFASIPLNETFCEIK